MDRLKPPQLLAYLVYIYKEAQWMDVVLTWTNYFIHTQTNSNRNSLLYIYIHKTFNSILTPTGPLKANERYI